MSDFHEMATHLKFRDTRALNYEDPLYMIDNGGRRLGIERRQFDYSIHLPERREGLDRRMMPERRVDRKPV